MMINLLLALFTLYCWEVSSCSILAISGPIDCEGNRVNFNVDDGVCKPSNTVAIRTGAFLPTNSLFRRIYGNVLECYEIELSQRQDHCWIIWENVDWLSKKGHSIGFHDPTRLSILNVSAGIKFKWEMTEFFTAYLGTGPCIGITWIKDQLHTTPHKTNRRVIVGGILKSNIHYYFNRNWYIDLFLDYLYEPYHFYQNVDFGGGKCGAGLGCAF